VPHSDRRSAADGHILIGGTGRAGTTLLVQYFTALDFDTGFTLKRALTGVDPISKAGLEHPLERTLARGRKLAYVAKSPSYGDNLLNHLESGELKVKHCIIPVRELGAAAESRRHVTRRAVAAGKPETQPQRGGVTARGKNPANQERKLAVKFHNIIYTMLRFDIPIHFLKFPEFARGEQDLYAALEPILVEHGVTREESDAALAQVLRPEYINEFPRPTS
jgi:hypothetical protein